MLNYNQLIAVQLVAQGKIGKFKLLVTWSFENQLLVIRSIDQLDTRSYWLCGQFALDKTVDHITDPHCMTIFESTHQKWRLLLCIGTTVAPEILT